MDALRLDVACAVIDDAGAVLLTPHTTLTGWALPEGPLDGGESLREAAARKVNEDAGLIVRVDKAVGLYYWVGLRRMTVLFSGWPLGGDLPDHAASPRAVRYFAPDALPPLTRAIMTLDALAGTRHKPRVVALSKHEQALVDSPSPWRLVPPFLRRKREINAPTLDVRAVGVIWDEGYRRVLTIPGAQAPALPRIRCHGEAPVWDQLADAVGLTAGFYPSLRWVGARQDLAHSLVEFVFAATTRETPGRGKARWETARNSWLGDPDAQYVARVKATYATDPVWVIDHERTVESGDTLTVHKENDTHGTGGTDRGRAR